MIKTITISRTSITKITVFVLLVAVTEILSTINLPTIYGFKIHLFQIAVFSGAIIFGPLIGAFIGGAGSIYSGILMHNPYLILGNILLGFFVGLFNKKGLHPVVSVLLSLLVQLPWLIISDKYFMHMPNLVLEKLVVALVITDILWVYIVSIFKKRLPDFS